MPSFVALLRGINVGGKVMVPMAELRAFFVSAGYADARTLLQSGNVVFSAASGTSALLEKQLEPALGKAFGREINLFVREARAWKKIVAENPFVDEAANDPGRLVVFCLRAMPEAKALAALKAAIAGREVFRSGSACLYIHYPDGQGDSKFTHALIQRKLGVEGTARNWNTVLKIAALLRPEA
jgi:uncharacterized protein (DUF1697 family)